MVLDLEKAVLAVCNGHIDSYAIVVRHCQEDVWRIAAFALHDVSDTEDLVQRVFVQAYTKLGEYQPGRGFQPWLRAIARNMVREELRVRERRGRHMAAYDQQVIAQLEPEAAFDSRQDRLRRALEHCRKELAPAAARAVELRYEQAMGFEAIAADLGRTVAAARQLLGRVRLSLRRCIEEHSSKETSI